MEIYQNQGSTVKCQEIAGGAQITTTINSNYDKPNIFITRPAEHTSDPIYFEIRCAETNFTGRSKELHDLKQFFQSPLSAAKKPYICVVSGMGGIGKTQLVSRFIEENRSSYQNIIWIDSENVQLINESFKRLAKDRLSISTINANGGEKDTKSVIGEVLNKLCKRTTLFIYDNVESIKYMKFVFTRILSGICPHVLITSRYQNWGDGTNVIPLGVWDCNEAIAYVSTKLNNPNDTEYDKKLLVETMQYFPLALRQATAYILYQRRSDIFDISHYLDKFHTEYDTHRMLDSKIFQEDPNNVYKRTTLTTWSITIETIQQEEKSGQLAVKILNLIAYFAADDIQRDFFVDLNCEKENEQADKVERLKSAINLLVNYSMIDSQAMRKGLNIHRLVQKVIKYTLRKEAQEISVLREALTLISQHIQVNKLLPHAVSVFCSAIPYPELIEEFSIMASKILGKLMEIGRYNQAKDFGITILEPLTKILGENQEMLKMRYCVADVCMRQGEYTLALTMNRYILKKVKALFGENHPETLKSKSQLADSYQQIGKCTAALLLNKETLAEQKIILGENHPDTIKTKIQVADTYQELGKYRVALRLHKEAFAQHTTTLGEYHPDTIKTKSQVADSYQLMGKYRMALRFHKEALDHQTANLGEHHPDTIKTKSKLADTYQQLGKYREALQLHQEALEDQMTDLGERHPDTIVTECNIAFSYLHLGQPTLAFKLYEEVLKKQMTISNEDHPQTLNIKSNIAFSHQQFGHYDLALQLFEEVFDKRKIVLGEDHPDTLTTKTNIALLYGFKGEHIMALQLYEEVYEKRKTVLGNDHPDTIIAMCNIAFSCRELDRNILALQLFEKAFEKQKTSVGEDHPDTIITVCNIAFSYMQLEHHILALRLYEKVLERQKTDLDENNPSILHTISEIEYLKKKVSNEWTVEKFCLLIHEHKFSMFLSNTPSVTLFQMLWLVSQCIIFYCFL